MKPKSQYKDESKWAVVLWKTIKKVLLHNFPNEYCNGRYIGRMKIWRLGVNKVCCEGIKGDIWK